MPKPPVSAKQKLSRYNRELTLLTTINDIILRVSAEQQLYQEVCNCIVTIGNYKLAWICQKPDESSTDQIVRSLAAAGITDYISNLRINLSDPLISKGPTGIALLTKKTFVDNNVTDFDFLLPWVERLKKYGMLSSIALYLDLGNGKTGALRIYAEREDAFDKHEVTTLERLAANLSIAVQNIYNRSELIESENRFRRAFEDSAIGMGITSIAQQSMGKWLKVNHSLCEMLGYTENELLALTFMQITHPDDLAKDLTAQDRILQGESDTYRIEKRYIHKNGGFVWINLNVSIVRNKDKQPIYLVAQVENITDKVESQIKFQNLVENFIVGVYILQNNKIVYVNPRVIEETGYTEKEIINMPFEHFIYPEDLKIVSDMIDISANVGLKTVQYEARIRRKDDKLIWYEILGGLTLYQGAPALIGTMVNITERKAIYEELSWSEANLRSIFDTTNVSYLLLDTNYNIIALNQQMKDVYIDVARVELKENDNLIELLLPEKREATKAVYDLVVQTNRSKDYETTYEKEGARSHFLSNVKPIYNGKDVIGICISAIDITEQKMLTNDLLNHVNAIEEQNKKLREIAWIQSHVVRAPLARLMGLIDLLSTHEDSNPETRTILDYIVTSANELDEIIKTITDKVYVD